MQGPLLVVAGAGSGKTAMMTRRIAYLVGHEGVAPYQILAVTFTNKAAQEMKERVEALVDSTAGMWLLTFHAACLRILRKHIDRIGYRPDFTIYDTLDQKSVLKECLGQMGENDRDFPLPYLQKIIGDCKNKGISPQTFQEGCETFRDRKIAQIFALYCEKLKKNNALDFDDMLLKTVELFRACPEVLREYQQRFQYLMVDEYQDTNQIQYAFIRLLAGDKANICVVGDDDQCIYQWRGADIRNILDFEKDFPGAKVVKLEQNYRSTGYILEAAHCVIRNNLSRKQKKLWSGKDKGEKPRLARLSTDKEEASFIAGEISRLREEGYRWQDMAILYRTHSQSRLFEEAFSVRGIPYRVVGGTRFYERKEIKDILAYCRLVQNTWDDVSLRRVINEPKRGIGDKSLEKLAILAQTQEGGLFGTMEHGEGLEVLSGKAAQQAAAFVEMIARYHEKRHEMKISQLYDALLIESGYLMALEAQNTIEAKSRIENLLEFKSVIYDFEHKNPLGTYEEFLEQIALLTDIDNHDANEEAVVLMTLHSAKGLEFPAVFMPGMEEGLFPGRRAMESQEGLEEERRLCYVGITRAKAVLYLTYAQGRVIFGRSEYQLPSRFLDEIDRELTEDRTPQRSREVFLETGGFDRARKGEGTPALYQRRREQEQKAFGETFFRGLQPKRKTPAAKMGQAGAGLSGAAEQGRAGKGPDSSFAGGERVRHRIFGEGLVIGVQRAGSGAVVTVAFDKEGVKKLDPQLAQLEKV